MSQAKPTRRNSTARHVCMAFVLACTMAGCEGLQRSPTGATPETVQRVYELHCVGCHGTKGEGTYGSNIQGLKRPVPDIARVIADGSGKMPAFRGHLTDEQMRELAEYVKSFK